MSNLADRKTLAGLLLILGLSACGADNNKTPAAELARRESPYVLTMDALGRPATPAEVTAWDIDVRPDFAGLPPGQGSVSDGEEVWINRCASCHGDFGDSNKFFSPLVLGNITEADIASGHVAALKDPTRVRTTLMKVATVSTLWDYIRRAMPWNDPKSLSDDDVYAVLAYLLNLAYIVDGDYVLSKDNIAEVQARMPNRNGMSDDHGLWKVDGRPDVVAERCLRDCELGDKVSSSIPPFARNAHGNLRDQMRIFGPHQGINTVAESDPTASNKPPSAALVSSGPSPEIKQLLAANTCTGCHQMTSKLVGPAFADIGRKYRDQSDAVSYLSTKIRSGGSGVWGGAMPPMPQLSAPQAEQIARWLIENPW